MPLIPAADAHAKHQPDRFSVGPARLTLLPADQVAALDPYMAQIVTYRKSGLSLNHIIGCPLDCGYCVRHFWGDFEHKTPAPALHRPMRPIGLLTRPRGVPALTPPRSSSSTRPPTRSCPASSRTCSGSCTRSMIGASTNLVLVITRFKVTAADMAVLEALRHLRVTLLFTYSGITDPSDRADRQEPHHHHLHRAPHAPASSGPESCCTGGRSCPAGTTSPRRWRHVLTIGQDRRRDRVHRLLPQTRERRLPARSRRRTCPTTSSDYHRRKPLPADLDAARRRRLARVGDHHAAVPQDLLRRRRPPTTSPTTTATGASANSATSAPPARPAMPRRATASPPGRAVRRRPGRPRLHQRLPHRRRPRLDPRPGRAAPLRHPAHPRLPDLGTRPAPPTCTPTAAIPHRLPARRGTEQRQLAAAPRPVQPHGRGIQTTDD